MKKIAILTMVCLFLFLLCQKNNPAAPKPVKSAIVSVNIGYQYEAGNMGIYSILDTNTSSNLLSIHEDNDIRAYDGSIYVLERTGKDNILKISGSVIAESTVVYQRNIGASVNIQDIAFISSTKAYITQYESSQLVVFNPLTGFKTGKTIDLSAYNAFAGSAEATAVPQMSRALYNSGKVYVACQRLKAPPGGWLSVADTSLIVVIDATSDVVEKAIKLNFKNPLELSIANGKLYVASVGVYGENDGGIECIDLASGTNEGSIATEAALHGDASSLIIISSTKGYAVITTATFTNELYPFNPQTKQVGDKISGIGDASSGHLAYDGNYVYVGDRSTINPGIVVIDPATDQKVGITKPVGVLPPNSLAYWEVSR